MNKVDALGGSRRDEEEGRKKEMVVIRDWTVEDLVQPSKPW